jgi:hypothetical protein
MKMRARDAVYRAIKRGVLAVVTTLNCYDCGEPARWYDHYLGYEPQHWLDVQPTCHDCDGKRRASRGEAHNKYTK